MQIGTDIDRDRTDIGNRYWRHVSKSVPISVGTGPISVTDLDTNRKIGTDNGKSSTDIGNRYTDDASKSVPISVPICINQLNRLIVNL